jgi:hypothetical protein
MALWRTKKLHDRHADVIAALEKYKLSSEWTREGGKYVPLPATWLYNERWESAAAIKTVSTGKPINEMNLPF